MGQARAVGAAQLCCSAELRVGPGPRLHAPPAGGSTRLLPCLTAYARHTTVRSPACRAPGSSDNPRTLPAPHQRPGKAGQGCRRMCTSGVSKCQGRSQQWQRERSSTLCMQQLPARLPAGMPQGIPTGARLLLWRVLRVLAQAGVLRKLAPRVLRCSAAAGRRRAQLNGISAAGLQLAALPSGAPALDRQPAAALVTHRCPLTFTVSTKAPSSPMVNSSCASPGVAGTCSLRPGMQGHSTGK